MFYSKTTGGFYSTEIHGNNIPADAVEISDQEHADLLSGQASGQLIKTALDGHPYLSNPPAPSQAHIIAQYETALDAHLDSTAQAHRYRDRVTFSLRAGYTGPYQAEGIAFAQWMDACNVQAFTLLQEVIAGTEDLPTIPQFIAGLPTFTLP